MTEVSAAVDPYTQAANRLKTLNKVMTTKAAIAQTPKQLVWTLNKAKLYRYTPVVPKEKRHPIPLLLVFALMNRPYILDLRPGHSFVEFMVQQGYDLYLLDWGAPGPEDKNLKFDDYTLDYMPRAIRKLKTIAGSQEFSLLGWCISSTDCGPVPQRQAHAWRACDTKRAGRGQQYSCQSADRDCRG